MKRHRESYFIVFLSCPTWAFWINRGTSRMSFSYRIFSFLRRRQFLRRNVTNDIVFKASAAETLNKCSRIVGSFKRQGLLHGSCLLYMSPFQIFSVNRTCVALSVINRFVIIVKVSRQKKNSAEWSLSNHDSILGIVKRNPLFFQLHSTSCKNNGFLFTIPNIYIYIYIMY